MNDVSGFMISCQELGWSSRVAVTLRISPSFFFIICGLIFVQFRNVIKHESLTILIFKNATFTPDTFRHKNSLHTRWPYHSGWMKLNKLHVDEICSGMIGEGLSITCIFPTITCDLECSPNATRCKYNGF